MCGSWEPSTLPATVAVVADTAGGDVETVGEVGEVADVVGATATVAGASGGVAMADVGTTDAGGGSVATVAGPLPQETTRHAAPTSANRRRRARITDAG